MDGTAGVLPSITVTALVLGPLLVALLAVLTGRSRLADGAALALAAGLLGLLAPLGRAVLEHGPLAIDVGGHPVPVAIPLHVDGLALGMLGLVTTLALLVHAHASAWLGARAPAAGEDYRPIWCVLWAGLNGLFLSGDLFNLYVMLEITTLGAVALVMLGGTAEAVTAAARYLFFALVGALLFLLGVALVYGEAGMLYMPELAGRLGAATGPAVALLLMTVGVAMKAALFPVHAWLPPAHSVAPPPASALLSGAVATAGVYLLLRLWLGPFVGAWGPATAQGMGALGAAGIVYGSLQALRQDRIKRIVAYSTVAQLGYLLLLIPLSASALAWQGAIYHAVSHGLAKAGIFLAAGNLVLAVGDDRLERLAGASSFAARNVLIIGVAGAAIAGLPPTGGFLAKWWLLSAALEQGQWWWVPVLALGGLLAAGYVFRILRFALLRPGADAPFIPEASRTIPPGLTWAPALLALAALALGFTGDVLAPVLAVIATLPADTGGAP